MKLLIRIYVKGSTRKNVVTAGVYRNDQLLFFKNSGIQGDTTRNQAEWEAVVHAMNIVRDNFPKEEIEMYTDSILVYKHLNGIFKIQDKELKRRYMEWNTIKNILKYQYSGCDIAYNCIEGDTNQARKYIKRYRK